MNLIPSTLGESFNAKQLSVAGVARDFIAPAQFYQLLGLNHCVLIGPRGSGKTTLLKMLEPDAPSAYSGNHDNAPSEISFIGVFVPADVRWAQQLSSQVDGIESNEVKERLYELAFGTSVLLAFLETIDRCIKISTLAQEKKLGSFNLLFERTNEVTLASRLAELWHTPIGVPSLSELKHRLRLRQTKFPQWALKLRSGISMLDLALEDPYVNLSWLDCVVTAIETVNEFTQNNEQRWALLLDELEIIPPSLLKTIVSCLRSTSANLIFKLALSPSASSAFSPQQDIEPSQGNDFKVLNLWYNVRDDLRVFAGKLMTQAFARRGYSSSEDGIVSLLGRSTIFEEETSNNLSSTSDQNSFLSKDKRQSLFSELAEKDRSFLDFLNKNGLNTAELDLSDSSKNGPLVRKITPLVQFRNRALRSWLPTKPVLRAGKISNDPYTGFPNILDITEGNPRWVLYLVDLLCAEMSVKSQGLTSKPVQASAITSMHQRFSSMLKIYPVKSKSGSGICTLYDFLERLAESTRKKLYIDAFSSDPAQSFEIDPAGAKEYGDFLEAAIHLGALVIMNPEAAKSSLGSPSGFELVGSRVRLCYRLAPEFFLPLRSTHSIRISSALTKSNTSIFGSDLDIDPNDSPSHQIQQGLF